MASRVKIVTKKVFMAILGYIRVSSDHQDLEKQRHLLLEYANEQRILIDEFIEAEASSQQNKKMRKVDEVLQKAQKGDTLIVAELSRLGRNMLETLNIINTLSEQEVKLVFIRQPELSTKGPQEKLLLAIYSYFAETEREFISIRTKQGLAAAKAKGVKLGRPKGSKNEKNRALDPYKKLIAQYLSQGINIKAISQIINPQLEAAISYNSFLFYVNNDPELVTLKKN